MPRLQKLDLHFDVDAVLRGQGADPAVMRARRPALVSLAEKAMQEALPLVEELVIYREYDVADVRHERLLLEAGKQLSGKLISQHLAPAKKIFVVVCSIGSSVEQYATEMWGESAAYSLALDGVGSAAVEALANAACQRLEQLAGERGWKTSIPLSPGMIDWPVSQGQPQIFNLLEGETLPLELTDSFIMIPRKSLSMVIGAGPDLATAGRTCDFCNLREVCRYQDHYS